MWRKNTEEKPSSPVANVPVATSVKPEVKSEISVSVPSPVTSPAVSPIASTTVSTEPVIVPVAAQPVPAQSTASPSPAPSARNVPRETSRITSGLKINGEVSGDTDLYIDGEMQGNIRLPGVRVCVGPQGKVKADIEAREIVIEGSAEGTLRASENLHLGGSSRVKGNIFTPRIGIEDGARLRGQVDMSRASGGSGTKGSSTALESEISRTVSA